MNFGRSLRPLLWLLIALGLVAGATLGSPIEARAAEPSTLTVQSSGLYVGGTVAISGTGWSTADGTAGSVIAVKIDDKLYQHLPGQTVDLNPTVWAVINAGPDGSFSTTITLPTSSNSIPVFEPGTHWLRLLTGSLKDGDEPRSVRSDDLTISAPAATKTAVSVVRKSSPYGTANIATVSLKAGAAASTGSVLLKDGSWSKSVVVPAAGSVKVALPATLGVGAHKLTAAFPGRTGLLPSSGSVSYAVVKATSATSLSLSRTKIKKSKRAVATVKVTAPGVTGPTGSLKVYDGSKAIKSATVSASAKGKVTITLPKLKKGTHKIKVGYAGSKTVKGSTSKVVKLKVTT